MFEKKTVIFVVANDSFCVEFALEIARQGAGKILLVGNEQDMLGGLLEQIREIGGQAVIKNANPADLGAMVTLAKSLEEDERFDYLINGTGYAFADLLPAKMKMRMCSKGAYAVTWVTDTDV